MKSGQLKFAFFELLNLVFSLNPVNEIRAAEEQFGLLPPQCWVLIPLMKSGQLKCIRSSPEDWSVGLNPVSEIRAAEVVYAKGEREFVVS